MTPSPSPPSPFYRVSVKALVFDGERRLLIGRRPDRDWQIPGGGWEHGESLSRCLQRELTEELGVGAAAIDESRAVVGAWPGPQFHNVKIGVPVILTSTDFTVSEEIAETRWATEAEFATLTFGGGDQALHARRDAIWALAPPA